MDQLLFYFSWSMHLMKFYLVIMYVAYYLFPTHLFNKYCMPDAILGLWIQQTQSDSLCSNGPCILMGTTQCTRAGVYPSNIFCEEKCKRKEEGGMHFSEQGGHRYWSHWLRSERSEKQRDRKWGQFLQREARVCLVSLRGIRVMAHGAKKHGRGWNHKWYKDNRITGGPQIAHGDHKIGSHCISQGFLNPGKD